MKFSFGNEMSAGRSSQLGGAMVCGAEGGVAEQGTGRMALYRLDVLVTSLSALLVAGTIISVAINNTGVHGV